MSTSLTGRAVRSVIAGALEDRSIKQGARAMADALARCDGAHEQRRG